MGHSDPQSSDPQYAQVSSLSRNISVISTASSSSSLVAPSMQPPSPSTPSEGRGRPPTWLSRRFNGDNSGQRTPRTMSRSPAASPSSTRPRMTCPDDFEFGEEIGGGSWSIVVEAVYPPTGRRYAIKILNKAQLVKEKMTQSAVVEKNALALLSAGEHPGIIRLYSAFHDATSLYLVLSLATNGDLRELVKSVGSFSTSCARYYAAQIVDAVQWMHAKGVLHRDLKPENVLLDENMRIKLADFGSAYISKTLDLSQRASTFVGTAAYVSPELLYGEKKTTGQSSDIWAIGCIIYFLLVGQSPFLALTDYLSFKKIEALAYTFMDGFDADAKDLVQRIIVTNPSERIGVPPKSSPNDLRNHPFFVRNQSLEETGLRTHPTDYIDWASLWIDPPVPIESGLVKPPPVNEQEEVKLQGGLPWDAFIREFSITNVEDDDDYVEPELHEKGLAENPQRGRENGQHQNPLQPSINKSVIVNNLVSSKGKSVDFSDGQSVLSGNTKVTRIPNEEDSDIPDRIIDTEHVDITKVLPWSTILFPSETIQLVTLVQVRTGHRLFQRTEQRTLALTDKSRIFCVKAKHNGTSLVVKQEFALTVNYPGSRSATKMIGAGLQGGHNLVLTTHEKSFVYKIHDASVAQTWISAIVRLMSAQDRK